MAKQKNEKDDSFLSELLELSGNEYGAITENGTTGDIHRYISTNSLLLNGLLSGSMFDGIAGNKITTFAGDASAGKTYIILDIVKNFLIENPTGYTIFFETESAISKQMLVDRGLDTRRILMLPVATIQSFRTQILKILDKYLDTKKSERKPMLFVLDSLGMLSTTKEVEDTAEGKETQDMTRARLIKGLFRVVTLKLGIADLPLLVTNHTYDEQGSMYPQKKMSGGSGIALAGSTTVFLSKAKDKDGTDVIGNIITFKLIKGRLTKENSIAKVSLNYQTGLSKYYGLLEVAVEGGIAKRLGNKYTFDATSDEPKYAFEKAIYKNPELYFTDDVLKKIDVVVGKMYKYGVGEGPSEDEDEFDLMETPVDEDHQ